jgi:hypothetical protein
MKGSPKLPVRAVLVKHAIAACSASATLAAQPAACSATLAARRLQRDRGACYHATV